MKHSRLIIIILMLLNIGYYAQTNKKEVTKTKKINNGNTKITNVTTYDFSTDSNKYYGNNAAVELEPGVWGTFSGDGDENGEINDKDKNIIWRKDNGTIGYKAGDYNVNGGVNIDDRNLFWRKNKGKKSQVP